jgi:hypothetical protein
MFSTLKNNTPEQLFWQWFEKKSARLMNFESDQEEIFDELADQMRQVHPDLTFEFGPVIDGKREFVVSADGIRDAFPAVKSLVDAAPSLEEWIIIPFRPPKGTEFIIQIGDYSLGPEDVWFSYEQDGDRIGLILYIKGLSRENEDAAAQASFILLDSGLGEYAVEEKIGFIERIALPDDPKVLDLHPFASIREIVENQTH